jgi:hypothetical protein
MQDEKEFLSPCGIHDPSRYHKDHPYVVSIMGHEHHGTYEPTQSGTGLFGGNSNWRGPIWFLVNYVLIESLQMFHYFLGGQYHVEYPTGSGRQSTFWQVAAEFSCRLIYIFLQNGEGKRPVFGGTNRFQDDPYWRNHVLFRDYFHRDNGAGIGASHQTDWTGLVAKLIQQSGD